MRKKKPGEKKNMLRQQRFHYFRFQYDSIKNNRRYPKYEHFLDVDNLQGILANFGPFLIIRYVYLVFMRIKLFLPSTNTRTLYTWIIVNFKREIVKRNYVPYK